MRGTRLPERGVGVLLCLGAAACSAPPPPDALRLVDVFEPERVVGPAAPPAAPPARTEWRFDGPAPTPKQPGPPATWGWRANADVEGLRVRDGRLEGRTRKGSGVIAIERLTGLEDPDLLHAIEVRARISAGANLAVQTRAGAVDLAKVSKPFAGAPLTTFTTPILPGDRPETYRIAVGSSVSGARIRSVLLKPSDAAGARFAIESVRLVFRKERLAELPAGVSWQGLSDVYQETIVTRAPQSARFAVTLPRRPVLDVSFGTPEDGPLTFRVGVSRDGGAERVLLEQTLTTPHRWERRRVDLAALAGTRAVLSFALKSDRPGAVGFWGAPTLRRLKAAARGVQGVILVQGDTLRIDHLDAYGYERPTAPTLRRLAERGVLFRNALAQTGWTKASASSVMTSLYPTSHNVHRIPDRLPASANTLAESFRAAGFATLALSSVAFTGRLTNLHQGFDELHEFGSLSAELGRYTSKTARPYVDRLVSWLEARPETPFFVYLHVFDPHSPYEPRPPYDTLWADPARRDRHLEEEERLKAVIGDPFLAERGMATREEMRRAAIDPEEHLRQHKDWYDGSIRGMDDELGRLLERMRALGIAERTLLAFFADHGEEFQDHGRMWHGHSVYGEMIRVPLVFAGPGVAAQPPRAEVVQLVDVMPTLLEASGIAAPAGIQGQSLMPLLNHGRRGSFTPRPAIAEKNPMADTGFPNAAQSVAVVDGEWKLIHNVVRPEGAPEYELFAFFDDPLDRKNVAHEHPQVVARLSQALAAWKRAALQARLRPDTEATEGMSSEQLEKLRALGYVQ